jgi:hypothetical protein
LSDLRLSFLSDCGSTGGSPPAEAVDDAAIAAGVRDGFSGGFGKDWACAAGDLRAAGGRGQVGGAELTLASAGESADVGGKRFGRGNLKKCHVFLWSLRGN